MTIRIFVKRVNSLAEASDDQAYDNIAVSFKDQTNPVSDLRKKLCKLGVMSKSDVFLLPQEQFALAKIDEDTKPWSILSDTGNVITILGLQTMSPKPHASDSETELIKPSGRLRGKTKSPKKKPLILDGSQGNNIEHAVEQSMTAPQSQQLPAPEQNDRASVLTREEPAVYTTSTPQNTQNIMAAADIPEPDWYQIIKDKRILHGVVMGTQGAQDDSGPKPADYPLVDYNADAILHAVTERTTVETHAVSTERNSRYLNAGWAKAAVHVSSPYAAASVEANYRETFSKKSDQKTVYITSAMMLQRARLVLDRKKISLSQPFQAKLAEALSKQTDDEKRQALNQLFDEFGHVFPTKILLGGSYIKGFSQFVRSTAEAKEKEASFSASLTAIAAGVSGGVGKNTTNERGNNVDNLSEKLNVVGGDTSLFLKPEEWVQSVQAWRSWVVIRTEEVVSIIDLLNDDDKKEVNRLAPILRFKALRGRWLESINREFTEGDCKGLRFYKPILTGEEYFWVGQTVDGSKALVVKELVPGALCEMDSLNIVWDSEKKFLGRPNYLADPIPKDNVNYASLGSCFFSPSAKKDPSEASGASIGARRLEGPWSRLRAVRKDLLVKATCQDTPYWTDKGTHGPKQGSVWLISPRSQNGETPMPSPISPTNSGADCQCGDPSNEIPPLPVSPPSVIIDLAAGTVQGSKSQVPVKVIDLKMFKAAQDRNKPTGDIWMLQLDEIDIEESI
ncbi:hypothetical protein CPB86DRAFT_814067 [Serendipita vermifera]|nr:hypothetical protein CPB86DRAFT_814067 [Serendipita vermifera]